MFMLYELDLLELEARKDLYKETMIWCITRFNSHPEIPQTEQEYYKNLLIEMKIELKKDKTMQDMYKTVAKLEKLKEELEQKYGDIFKL